MDIPLMEAMLCYNTIGTRDPDEGWVKVIKHPARLNGHIWEDEPYLMTVGACFSYWRKRDDIGRKLQLMIEVWHAVAFYGVPPDELHNALLVIPEYRTMLADDCLPSQFHYERV